MRTVVFLSLMLLAGSTFSAPSRPNIVIILADDLGYGDLSVQGHPLIHTPHIDQLARNGQRWTSFYASASVCGPSRLALMTGRMPARIAGMGNNTWVALPDSEFTLAEMLKQSGYTTAFIGKWGVTAGKGFDYAGGHPNDQGFDFFYGTDNGNYHPWRKGFEPSYESIKRASISDFPIPLYRQRQVVEEPLYQPTITKRLTEESINWMQAQSDRPFLLLLSHNMPHVPLFRSPQFEGHSRAGAYGDVVEEVDWSVGRIVEALGKIGLAENTLVLFTSDNGPWLELADLGGSSGPLRGGKGSAWEGGFRVPAIFSWPGTIKPAVVDDIGVNVDLMKTIASMVGASLPGDRVLDSIDLSPTLLQGRPSERKEWFFYNPYGELWAARVENYKLVFKSFKTESPNVMRSGKPQTHVPPLLFDLRTDISESGNLASQRPEIIDRIQKAVKSHEAFLSKEGA